MGNIIMHGLEEASASTFDWPQNSGGFTVIKYDVATGDVWASDAVGDVLASEYEVFRTAKHVSADRIAEEITAYVARRASKGEPGNGLR